MLPSGPNAESKFFDDPANRKESFLENRLSSRESEADFVPVKALNQPQQEEEDEEEELRKLQKEMAM